MPHGYKSQLNTGTWHYIDLPFSLDGTSTNGFVPASFDVVLFVSQWRHVSDWGAPRNTIGGRGGMQKAANR